jgi:hypothetical protein
MGDAAHHARRAARMSGPPVEQGGGVERGDRGRWRGRRCPCTLIYAPIVRLDACTRTPPPGLAGTGARGDETRDRAMPGCRGSGRGCIGRRCPSPS